MVSEWSGGVEDWGCREWRSGGAREIWRGGWEGGEGGECRKVYE